MCLLREEFCIGCWIHKGALCAYTQSPGTVLFLLKAYRSAKLRHKQASAPFI